MRMHISVPGRRLRVEKRGGRRRWRKPGLQQLGCGKNIMFQVLSLTVSLLASHSSLAKYKSLIVSGFTAQGGLGQKVYVKYDVSLCPSAADGAVKIQI